MSKTADTAVVMPKKAKQVKSAKRPVDSDAPASKPKKIQKVKTVIKEEAAVPAEEVTKDASKGTEKSRAESRKEQKELAKERRLVRPFADVVNQLNPLWDIIRQKTVSAEDKIQPIEAALKIAHGHIRDLAVKSDGSRILQSIVTYCSEAQRVEISKELTHVSKLAADVRAVHLVKKLVKISSASRAVLMAEMRGHVDRFFKSRTTCSLVDDLYAQLNATNKMNLIAELYSVEFAMMKVPEGIQTLPQLLAKYPAKRDVILDNLRKFVTTRLNKQILDFGVVQRILTDYLSIEVPAKLVEKTEVYMEHLEALLQTPAGCSALVRIIAASAAKERKVIVKTFKAHLSSMVDDLSTAQVLMAILCFTDDTVLVGKAIVQELAGMLNLLVAGKTGQRVVLMVLAGAQDKYVTPGVASLLRECESFAVSTSKKDSLVRRKELLGYLLPALNTFVDERLGDLATNVDTVPILVEYLSTQPRDRKLALVDRLVDSVGGFAQLAAVPATCSFLRLVIKTSEEISQHIYGRFCNAELREMLKGTWSFVFLLLVRWDSLKGQLGGRRGEIEEAAKAKVEMAEKLLVALQKPSVSTIDK